MELDPPVPSRATPAPAAPKKSLLDRTVSHLLSFLVITTLCTVTAASFMVFVNQTAEYKERFKPIREATGGEGTRCFYHRDALSCFPDVLGALNAK